MSHSPAQVHDKMEAVLEFLDRADERGWGIEDMRVTRDGRIGRREPGKPIRFSFRCFEVPVKAEARLIGGTVDLELAAVIGAVPFTAEAAEARKRILSRVRGQNGLLLTDGRNLCAYGRMRLQAPVRPDRLITELVCFMLQVKPEVEGLEPLLPTKHRIRGSVAA
ncbi:MAG: hypothetical protein ACK4QW_15230 [Alphaproteobacteria bacterium]